MRAAFALLLGVGLAGCHFVGSGTSAEEGPVIRRDAALPDTSDTSPPDGDRGRKAEETGLDELGHVAGPPAIVGCSDGTREGFRDLARAADIAGCAGAWSVAGVLGDIVRQPACDRRAGDTSSNPGGEGCTVTDLCAADWHVCRDGGDVEAHSPGGGCEGSLPANERAFFLVLAGASPQGVCYPAPGASNDLHGCGTLGQPEVAGCPPLSRRMGFADCRATGEIWLCGSEDEALHEALVVTKPHPALGGVLCCRD
jgi:hypothetical protein